MDMGNCSATPPSFAEVHG